MPEPPATAPDVCSAKGCTAPAEHALLWNNPKVHTPERRKVWLACAEHRESLGSFLSSRGFLKDVVAHSPGADPTV
ncbi:acetone carboxylase [Nocardioides sp. GY 10127]|nr:acetone carboxylase [Nocardioides sp. GY 10127]